MKNFWQEQKEMRRLRQALRFVQWYNMKGKISDPAMADNQWFKEWFLNEDEDLLEAVNRALEYIKSMA